MAENTKPVSWAEKALGFVLLEGAGLIFSGYLIVWRFLKYQVLKLPDWRIIYGTTASGRQIFHFAKQRCKHVYIKGLTGFGKSALAAILALQIIRQKGGGIFLDAEGSPRAKQGEQGAIVMIWERAESVENVVFLSVNQKKKVIGENPLFYLASFKVLDRLKDYLLTAVYYDSKSSINSGYQVPNEAEFILESAIYFHDAYLEWLVKVKKKSSEQTRKILLTHQLTFNDLAHLTDNPKLIDLFIEILGFKGSKYYRPDLVIKWQNIKEKNTFDIGFKGAVGRFRKIVTTGRSRLFFESCGFDVLKERKKGKFVLCDLSGLDDYTTAMICKFCLVRIYLFQARGIFWEQTDLFIDEASNVEIPNLPHIINQGRKKRLALTLIFHYSNQFKNPDILHAIQKGMVTKINFKNHEGDLNISSETINQLKEQEFIFSDTWERGTKCKTVELPPVRRAVHFEQRGVAEKVLRKRMLAKRINSFNYFTTA